MSVAFKDVALWRDYIRNIDDLRDHDAMMLVWPGLSVAVVGVSLKKIWGIL